MRREKILVVDVETAGGFARPLVYDLGFAVVERSSGRVVETKSLVIDEVFYGMADKMSTAYYADKVPAYHEGIAAGAFRVVSFWDAWKMVRGIMRRHGITKVYAYNCSFDKGALDSTYKAISGRRGSFFPTGTEFCDIWHMACQTILRQPTFRKFATAHDMVSPCGNYRTSAEVAYAYITKCPTFEESHTGLDDVIIEAAILNKIMRQKRKIDHGIIHNPWRIAQIA